MSLPTPPKRTAGFQDFADYLFSLDSPEPRSIDLDLGQLTSGPLVDADVERPVEMDFLYSLFVHGFRKKFSNVPLTNLNEEQFIHIRTYIRALGYEAYLINFQKDDQGNLTNVNVGFGRLPEE